MPMGKGAGRRSTVGGDAGQGEGQMKNSAGEASPVDRSVGTENCGAGFWKSWLDAQVLPVWRRSDVIAREHGSVPEYQAWSPSTSGLQRTHAALV